MVLDDYCDCQRNFKNQQTNDFQNYVLICWKNSCMITYDSACCYSYCTCVCSGCHMSMPKLPSDGYTKLDKYLRQYRIKEIVSQ